MQRTELGKRDLRTMIYRVTDEISIRKQMQHSLLSQFKLTYVE